MTSEELDEAIRTYAAKWAGTEFNLDQALEADATELLNSLECEPEQG